MNAQELIGSGLLEAHVLGQTTAEEARLVERMRAEHADVARELEAIELSLEAHAMKQAVRPSDESRDAIMRAIDVRPGRVIPLNNGTTSSTDRRWFWLVAASVTALIASAALNFSLYNRLRDSQDRLANSEAARSVLAQDIDAQRASLQRTQEELAIVTDPGRVVVPLAGKEVAPDARARIYWDPTTHAVHLEVAHLPAPPPGKQYQLWAIADGQPIDAGVFDMGGDTTLHGMKDITSAQAFAVTLEKSGGSPVPTLEAMYLLGTVAGS